MSALDVSSVSTPSSVSASARKLRLLHVTSVHPPFDTRVFAKEARSLAAAGHDVTLATTVQRAQRLEGVSLLPLGAASGPRLLRIARDLRALVVMLRRRYDIIHIHDPELLIAAAVPMLLGRSVVYDVHEFYADELKVKHWLHPALRRLASNIYEALEAVALRSLAGIVVVSDAMRSRYVGRVPPDRIATVRNYPSISAQDRAEALRVPPDCPRPYIVHTGGANKIRAFHTVVAAAERLRARGIAAPLVNVGPVDLTGYGAAEAAALERRAARVDVRSLGRIPYVEALRWTAHARVGYLPLEASANNALGLPNKIFEYFAFGLPVVATSLRGPVDEIMRETHAGLLVAPGNGEQHAAALEHLLLDDAAHDVAAASSRAAGDRYTFAGELSALERLYRTIATTR